MPVLLAQTAQPDAGRQPQPFTNSLTGDVLTDLPSGSTIFSLLDTAFAELISDRDRRRQPHRRPAAALGRPRKLLDSDDVPYRRRGYFRSGRERHAVRPAGSAWMGADGHRDRRAAGRLELPRTGRDPGAERPAAAWTRFDRALWRAFGPALPDRDHDPARRLRASTGGHSASLLASGPLIPGRLGMVLSAAVHQQHSLPARRSDPASRPAGFGLDPSRLHAEHPRTTVRVMGWVERTRSPFNHRVAFGQPAAAQRATSVHLQSAWDRPRNADSLWTGFASFSARRRTTDLERVPTAS